MKKPESYIVLDQATKDVEDTLESQFSILTINSEGYFLLVDKNKNVVAFNKAFYSLYSEYFGIKIVKGDSILNLTPPERIEEVKMIYENAINGIVYECELELPLPNGETIIFKSSYRPAYNAKKEIIGAILHSNDVTKIKHLEQEKEKAIKQTEIDNINFRALIDHSKDMIWSFDLNYNLINCNASFEKYFTSTYNLSLYPNMNFLEILDKFPKGNMYKSATEKAYQGEIFKLIDYSNINNKDRWREVSLNPIFERLSNNVIGVACISRDVTEIKNNEKNLLISEKRLKQAQKIAGLGSWHFDLKTKFSSLSEEALNIFGISAEKFDNQYSSLLKKIHIDDQFEFQKAISEAVLFKKDFNINYRIVKEDGGIVHIYTVTDFEYDENGNAVGFYGIILDVSDRVIKEAELKKLLFLTQKHNEWLNNFTHIVSHNIRSNNNNIRSLVELLLENTDGDRDLLLKMLKTSTGKLDETIYHLSEFVRFQNQNEKNYQLLNLKSEINKSTEGINQHIVNTNSTIVNDVDDKIFIKAVPAFLESILINLLTNAIKYRSLERPLILKYSCEQTEDFCILTIEDNGLGIDMDKYKNSIFGLFKTFHGNSDSVGLGLFMTKNQIELMQGKIEIESTLRKGTIFKLYFYEKN